MTDQQPHMVYNRCSAGDACSSSRLQHLCGTLVSQDDLGVFTVLSPHLPQHLGLCWLFSDVQKMVYEISRYLCCKISGGVFVFVFFFLFWGEINKDAGS